MFVPVILATVCLASSSVLAAYDKPYYEIEDAENLFNDFIKEHKKIYNRREYYERLEIFKETLKDINERNAKFPDTVFAVNHFADLKPHELQQYDGFKPSNETMRKLKIPYGKAPPPAKFDWRDHHAVSRVKNELQCGSSYIFSAIGNIEGQYAIKHGQCLALSEGQALDCLKCGSCNGGRIHDVMSEIYIMKLEKEEDYPYYPAKGPCKLDVKKGIVKLPGIIDILLNPDEEVLRNALVFVGPLSIAIEAHDLLHYKGGILEPHKKYKKPIYRSLLLVGYGEEKGKKFWIIKNSWGEKWGEKGYLRIVRGQKAFDIGSYVVTTYVD